MRLLRLLLLTPLALAGVVVLMLVFANLEHWLGKYGTLAIGVGLICLRLLLSPPPRHRPAARRISKSGFQLVARLGRCAYCRYDLAADLRNPDYCPQCGSSQSQEAHLRRRKELLLELQRLQMELVRNHRERLATSKRIQSRAN
jgi:hypothetical protein